MRLLKIVGYIVLFVVSFAYFFYRAIPYESVKDRLFLTLEQQMGGGYGLNAKELSPYYLTGVELEDVKIMDREGKELLRLDNLRGRASFFSLLTGSPSISFTVELGKGEIDGYVRPNDEGWRVELELDDFDVGAISMIKRKYALNLSSKINGKVKFEFDGKKPVMSNGELNMKLGSIDIKPGKVMLMGSEFDVPAIVLTKRSGSLLNVSLGKGVLEIKDLKLSGGDLQMDVRGKMFLSQALRNWRFNINGRFMFSESLEKALPFLFIIERQKQQDGYYPIAVTGRWSRPIIKVGNFTVPL